ncbi:MAG TPA: hypothetical protein VHG08_13195 [Longimicrobium sp.]|nr:hypothetical protein [Longimicrobium sp.]
MSYTASTTRPPLRSPARWRDAVRAELVVLREARALHWGWLILFLAVQGITVSGDPNDPPFSEVRFLAATMFFFPLAWQGEGGSRRRDTALPMEGVALELVRLACGALCAALLLGLGTAAYTAVLVRTVDAPGTLAGFPAWYPLALFIIGMANYLFGSALALQGERPGRLLVPGFVLGTLALLVSGVGVETTEHRVEWNEDGSRTWTATTSLTPASALFRLALGGLAVALSVAAARSRRAASWSLPNPLRGRAAAAHARPRPRAAALRVPRPAAPLSTVAARQFVVQAPRMVWPLLLAGLAAWALYRAEIRAAGDTPAFIRDAEGFVVLMYAAFLWPILVWMEERHDPWDGAQPAGTVARRLLHAGAGAAWLQVHVLLLLGGCVWGAMAAGTLSSPLELPAYLWPGLPLATLAVYSLGTLPVVLTERPVLAGIVYGMVLPVALIALDVLFRPGFSFNVPPGPLSPTRLFAPMGWVDPEEWSIAVALLWTPVFVAMGAGAIWLRAWWERYGRSLSLREVIRLVRPRRAFPAR